MLHVVYYLLSCDLSTWILVILAVVECCSLLFVFASAYEYDSPCFTFSLLLQFFFPLFQMFKRKLHQHYTMFHVSHHVLTLLGP